MLLRRAILVALPALIGWAEPPPSGGAARRIVLPPGSPLLRLAEGKDPIYPELAQRARIRGSVRFSAIIGTGGEVLHLALISGHPLLVNAAREAAETWVYEPVLIGGKAVEVITQIRVHFQPPRRARPPSHGIAE
jgi:protein TonB